MIQSDALHGRRGGRHILLIGHRTAGKTTLGSLLAARLGSPFIDVDARIEAATGAPCATLARRDEASFRRVEQATITDIVQSTTPAVIACGAGMAPIPVGHLTIAIHREGWEDSARALRGPLRDALSNDEEMAWMRATRTPRYHAAAHARLHIARGTPVDRALGDLMQLVRMASCFPQSLMAPASWLVPRSTPALARAEADARLMGCAGVEIRSDIMDTQPVGTPWLASLRTPDPDFLLRHHGARAFDCDIRFLGQLRLDGLEPRPLILSLHPDVCTPGDIDALGDALHHVRTRHPEFARELSWKYAPRISSWRQLRACLASVDPLRDAEPAGTFLPQGGNWYWLRIILANSSNRWNYIHVHDGDDAGDAPLPPDFPLLLPHALPASPAELSGLIGLPVSQSIGDMWHRVLADADPAPPSSYVKIPVAEEDVDAALGVLTTVGVTGLSVTAPLKRVVAESTRVDNPDRLPAGNTLTRCDGRWVLSDTDEAGMDAALAAVEAEGVGPGRAWIFGSGGVVPAVERALASRGWTPVARVQPRTGWRGEEAADLIVNAAGPAAPAAQGAPACRAWLDLHHRDAQPPPHTACAYHNGRIFFEAQAAAQRTLWRDEAGRRAAAADAIAASIPDAVRDEALPALHALLRRFPLRNFSVDIDAHRRLELTTARDVEELIGSITEDEFRVDEQLPYWAELWHSAIAVAGTIADAPGMVRRHEVLEVGCGLGVPGIVAALCGAQVTFTDNDPLALHAARINLLRNAPGAEASFHLQDFRRPPRRTWPVIIAADVLYERRYLDPFAEFLRGALAPDGIVVLAEPNRSIAESFFTAIISRGFRIESRVREAGLHGRTVAVGIHLLRHAGTQ